jgi:uncharacterized protein (DUF1330 family)
MATTIHSGTLRPAPIRQRNRALEGEWPHTRTVLIEFPSDQAVREFYDSDAYQAIVGHRHAAASAEIAIVSGFG